MNVRFFAIGIILINLFVLAINRYTSVGLLSLYGLLAVGRIVWQIWAARKVRLSPITPLTSYPSVSVIMPTFNEAKENVRNAAISVLGQAYKGKVTLIVVDDGSENQREVYDYIKDLPLTYLGLDKNVGKRHAMYEAFKELGKAELVATADSDSEWAQGALEHLVEGMTEGVGAVTGYVAAANPGSNLLTRLISLRYHMAFEQERAAQSLFGTVTCVSGPLGLYRRSIIEKHKENFINQRFLGKPCTFGDDRHLTNLTLIDGWKVVYSKAKCYTNVPENLKQFVKQQTRWGKSHWREMIWQLKALPKHHVFLTIDWWLTIAMPFVLTLTIGERLISATTNINALIPLGITIFGMGWVRSIEPYYSTKNPWFLAFPAYSLMHLVVLLPVKFYSLFTVSIGKWGTR